MKRLCFGMKECVYLLSCVLLFVTLWTVAHQAPLSMGILQARILEWVAMPSSRDARLSITKYITNYGLKTNWG